MRGLLNSATKALMQYTNQATLVPTLDAARPISKKDFSDEQKINVAKDAVGEYKIIDATDLLADTLELYRTRQKAEAARITNAILRKVVPHLRVDGEPVAVEDTAIYGFNLDRGTYYPCIHWDTDWAMFHDSPGFQVWFMLDPPNASNLTELGSMFAIRSPHLHPYDPPFRIQITPKGQLIKYVDWEPRFPFQTFESWKDYNMTFEYLAMPAGELFIMSKRTMHYSDPRPNMRAQDGSTNLNLGFNRLALNFRVMVKRKQDKLEGTAENPRVRIPFWSGHPYNSPGLYKGLKKYRHFIDGVEELHLSRFDFMHGTPPQLGHLGVPSHAQKG